MNINSPDVNINEYKLLCVNTLNLTYSFEKLAILHYLGFSKHLTEIDLDFIDTYHELEIYVTIINYKNDVKRLKEFKELKLLREQEINEINKETKIKLNVLNDEINDVLEKLEFELEHGTLKNRYLKKLNSYEDRIKLRLSAKEEINEIERLKKEVENNEDKLLDAETKISKLLTDLEYENKDILHNIEDSILSS